MENNTQKPYVYNAVRAIGVIKPKFDNQKQNFLPPQLEVIGTAFWLKDYKVIISCAHVVRRFTETSVDQAGMLVIGKKGNYQPIFIDSVDYAHDLAVLRLMSNDNALIEKEAESGLSVSDKYYDVATNLAYAGYPLGNQLLNQKHEPTYSEGVIGIKLREHNIRKEIQISGPIIGGFSGSPIVLKDDSSKIVAVVSNGPADSNKNSNIFMGISWEHVKAIAKLAKS